MDWGVICVEINDNNGPPECILDCEGIEYINPEENPYETCDWIISNFGPNNFINPCAEDCDNETMMDINEYMDVCFQCLADNNCDSIFDDNDDQDGCFENGEWYGYGQELFLNNMDFSFSLEFFKEVLDYNVISEL
jgi:hypothetical protein